MRTPAPLQRIVSGVLVLCLAASGCSASRATRRGGTESVPAARPEERVPLIPEAYHYYTTGNYLSAAGNDSAAIHQYRRALTYDPGSREIRRALANAYARRGRYDEAAITAESIRPRDSDVLSFLAEVYGRMRNQSRRTRIYEEWSRVEPDNPRIWQYLVGAFRASGDTTAQIRALESLARIQPEPATFEQVGFLLLQSGSPDSAEPWFRRAIANDSSQRATRVMLGMAQIWNDREEPDSAYLYYKQAVEFNYYNTELRKRFFAFLLQQGRATEAVAEARLILKLSPDEPEILYRLAVLEYDQEEFDSSEVHITDWIARYRDDGVARFLLGRIALSRGDTITAEAQYLQSLELADSLVESYLALGFLYNRQAMHDSAVTVYTHGLEARPDQPDLLFGLGAALEQAGQYEASVSTFEHLLAVEPEHAPALNYLGYMWADSGIRLAEALALIERAVELQPDNGAYLDSYAWVLYRLGRTHDAERKLQEALAYIQDDAVVFEHYGDILADLGRLEEAQENWQRALDLDPQNAELREKLNR